MYIVLIVFNVFVFTLSLFFSGLINQATLIKQSEILNTQRKLEVMLVYYYKESLFYDSLYSDSYSNSKINVRYRVDYLVDEDEETEDWAFITTSINYHNNSYQFYVEISLDSYRVKNFAYL